MIEIINLKKGFKKDHLVHEDINLKIPDGQMTVIVGRSGEGKSLLLKQMIGLIKPNSGQILIDDTDITKLSSKKLEQVMQKFGYVFQFAALLDSLNVFENVGLALLENGQEHKKVWEIVKNALAAVHLNDDVMYKYPAELSGGMRKRVGLARTLVTNPNIVLYDEPTTGLDPITAKVIHELMANMQKKFNLTSVVISHDLEIFKYADQIALIANGQIRFFGAAKTVWESDNPYIYQFIRGLPEGPLQTDTPHTSFYGEN